MAKEYAKAFYNSKAWYRCKEGYLKSQGYICERCGDVASVVHHKRYITPQNIQNPEITLNFDNLEALCAACHNQEHHKNQVAQRYKVDERGRVILIAPRS